MTIVSCANISSSAFVPTENGSRYLQQLCKHWSHSLNVEFTPEYGRVIFPKNARGSDYPGDAIVTFNAVEGGLNILVDASSDAQLEAMKSVVERHLDRFAFRENGLPFDWH
ncbi:MAG TPA: DUF2218 domain-containing protein [Sphingomicrobium sp.]|nr:DUF2218 domain-containing protein [Sphingomicrobium sp.]